MKSWHFNEVTNSSCIKEVLDVLNKDNFCYIFTEDADFIITHEDTIKVGVGALMIVSEHDDGRWVELINTNKITHLEVRPIDKD